MNVVIKKFENSSDTDRAINLTPIPDTCPVCQKAGDLKFITGYGHAGKINASDGLQIIFQCPRVTCKKYSIAYYRFQYNDFSGTLSFTGIAPKTTQKAEFTDNIRNISQEFIEIYNQALQAEDLNLNKIAGCGYRKSLEYLIKDYLISKSSTNAEEIKRKFLGICIKEEIADANIKAVAERATWLGNDETHYTRIWQEKDINDLKMLITLTVHWIDSEMLTAQLIADMPAHPSSTKEGKTDSETHKKHAQ